MKIITNLIAWSQERFPLSQGVFIAVLYITAVFYGQFMAGSLTLTLGPLDILGFGACWSVFLMLRIFDEHKDFALDLHNYPDRVLQSGRITLGHLKVLCLIAIVFQAGYSMICDQGLGIVTYYWLAVLGWSLLMKVEFFVPAWLTSHLPVYGVSHMLIMLPIMGWLMQTGAAGSNLAVGAWWLAGMAFFAGCTFEMTRKAWGKEEERETIDSYARRFGTTGVAIAISLTLGVAIVASIAMLQLILPSTAWWVWFATPLLGWLLVIVSVFNYAKLPTIKARKKNEAMVGLALLLAYGTPLIAMIVNRGITWTL